MVKLPRTPQAWNDQPAAAPQEPPPQDSDLNNDSRGLLDGWQSPAWSLENSGLSFVLHPQTIAQIDFGDRQDPHAVQPMAASVFASDDYYGVPYSTSDATQSGSSGDGSTFHITADEPAFAQLPLDLKKLSAMPTLPEPGTGITPWINSDNKAIDANGNLTGEEVVVTPADNLRGLAKILGMGEGNYESYNSGTDRKSGKVLHGAVDNPKGTVTGKTINQILASSSRPATDTTRMFAVGAYQIIPNTLKGAMTALGLTGNERFTPGLQDRIFRDYLIKQGGGALANLVVNGEGTVDAAQYSAAKTWASIATPAGDRVGKNAGSYVSDGTDSYYEGPANHANMNATNALRSYLSAFLPR